MVPLAHRTQHYLLLVYIVFLVQLKLLEGLGIVLPLTLQPQHLAQFRRHNT